MSDRETRCVLYARLSVTKEESVSIERQLESCRAYAKARSWDVLGEFVDDGVSATVNRPEDRKGWASLLESTGFEAVVIWKVDRLARKVLDFLHTDQALRKRGAGLVAVADPIDMTTPQGRAFATMLAVFGEMEAEAIRARVKAAHAQILKAGRWPGGGVPFGFMTINNPSGPGKVLVKNPDTITVLTWIVNQALANVPVNAIARALTDQGVAIPGRQRNPGLGAPSWSRQTIMGLLRNPVLAGMRPYNPGRGRKGGTVDPFSVVRDDQGDPVINEALAVISVEQFTGLQHALNTSTAPQARKKNERQETNPFLSRVAHCDPCGVFLCRGTNQGKPVLTCPQCRQTIGRTYLDPYIISALLKKRGKHPWGDATLKDHWRSVGKNHDRRRDILLTQIEDIHIRRGVVGRYFDPARVTITWAESQEVTE